MPDCPPLHIETPHPAMGVAESWNWFVAKTHHERLIVNDDVTFAPESLERIFATPGACVTALKGHAFSCFLLRDACVAQVGLFDETLSPGYGYFEDCDYEARMRLAGVPLTNVDCGVRHVKSATLAAATEKELAEHHVKFLAAQGRFLAKWGRLPEGVLHQNAVLKG